MRYKHFKGGIYEVVEGEAVHTETGEVFVVYRSTDGKVWVRPKESFEGYVEGGKTKRFERVDNG